MKALLQILRILNIKIENHRVFSNPLYDIIELRIINKYQFQKCIGKVDEICQFISHQPVSVFPIRSQLIMRFEIPKHAESISLKEISEIPEGNWNDDTMNLPYIAGYNIYQQAVMMDLNAVSNLMVVANSEQEISHYVGSILKQICNVMSEELFNVGYIGCRSEGIDITNQIPNSCCYRGHKNRFGQCSEPIFGAMNQVVEAIESRYRIFRKRRVKNLLEYNMRSVFKFPHLCFIIFDYVELINRYGAEFTSLLGRIAVLGKLTGVHIVIATKHCQREKESVFVTGNFQDKIILNNEYLNYLSGIQTKGQVLHVVGNGDVLYVKSGNKKKTKVQRLYYPMGV